MRVRAGCVPYSLSKSLIYAYKVCCVNLTLIIQLFEVHTIISLK